MYIPVFMDKEVSVYGIYIAVIMYVTATGKYGMYSTFIGMPIYAEFFP